jgi:hypothetical protein
VEVVLVEILQDDLATLVEMLMQYQAVAVAAAAADLQEVLVDMLLAVEEAVLQGVYMSTHQRIKVKY